ncbi:hypothetical protein M885DRAFT_618101 [Pelagophyceae sp. CCMP2097]|nr:hypothetical protein M885DRAFT_618101 [Pelagophyceae sp. CCMP2097]|mmetsp:Transcript_9139/g.30214  ORF Transcript_9139/g.30214 Transcript_9139/m.30214 type:complete len:392 (-) Transcript_9139:18-1193(-)
MKSSFASGRGDLFESNWVICPILGTTELGTAELKPLWGTDTKPSAAFECTTRRFEAPRSSADYDAVPDLPRQVGGAVSAFKAPERRPLYDILLDDTPRPLTLRRFEQGREDAIDIPDFSSRDSLSSFASTVPRVAKLHSNHQYFTQHKEIADRAPDCGPGCYHTAVPWADACRTVGHSQSASHESPVFKSVEKRELWGSWSTLELRGWCNSGGKKGAQPEPEPQSAPDFVKHRHRPSAAFMPDTMRFPDDLQALKKLLAPRLAHRRRRQKARAAAALEPLRGDGAAIFSLTDLGEKLSDLGTDSMASARSPGPRPTHAGVLSQHGAPPSPHLGATLPHPPDAVGQPDGVGPETAAEQETAAERSPARRPSPRGIDPDPGPALAPLRDIRGY